jgi:hypothetical protein
MSPSADDIVVPVFGGGSGNEVPDMGNEGAGSEAEAGLGWRWISC